MAGLTKVYKTFEEWYKDNDPSILSSAFPGLDAEFVSRQIWEACATSKDHEYCARFFSIGGALAKIKKIVKEFSTPSWAGQYYVVIPREYNTIMECIAIIERGQNENINPDSRKNPINPQEKQK